MTRLSSVTLGIVAAMVLAACGAAPAQAQCSTCGTQTVFSPVIAQPQATVAYSPVVAAPVVVAQPVRTGWYPGRMLDNWRINRWTNNATWGASTVAVAAPMTQTVGFAPAPVVQTVGFAPMASVQTVNFAPSTPYVTGYAPMQRTYVSYAPSATTVYSPAIIEPVVSASACSTCSTCVDASPCSACAGGTAVVEQAAYSSPVTTVAPATGCSSCAEASSSVPTYSYPAGTSSVVPPASTSTNTGPATPQPSLADEPPPTAGSQEYGAQRPESPGAGTTGGPADNANGAAKEEESSVVAPKPMGDEDPAAGDTSTFQAPPLLGPQNDRTANRPTVDIHDAVYRQPARKANVGTTTVAKPVTPVSAAASQTDAHGWYSVSER
jgi:hypothetical protein